MEGLPIHHQRKQRQVGTMRVLLVSIAASIVTTLVVDNFAVGNRSNSSLFPESVMVVNSWNTTRSTRDMLRSKTYYRSDLEQLLVENRASPKSMVPLRPSPVDLTFLDAKVQMKRAPALPNDDEPDLYPPAFRNFSSFKRSYELMEENLKVYVYKEGDRPIFHEPLLKGIYASEGWFMKHMEENQHFVVDDPSKAHLFYMPFSSRLLQLTLFDFKSRSKAKMYDELSNYVRNISTNYPFWNRSGGADHFAVCCHDWSVRETSKTMETSLRALCGADIHEGFEVGKDISLPESNILDEEDPLLDVGGKPANERSILAFFAGNMLHGHVRPILQRYWGNDSEIKIRDHLEYDSNGRLIYPRSERRRVSRNRFKYNMKNSKYCICPRGYEVNSPRLVESIFYDCVPVIISDNYVPPFFEILNWDAFSLTLPESDLPRLKEILQAIPQEKYEELHKGVRMIQKHFLWNKKPLKYDMFHMVLYNAWFNRIFQLRFD